MKQGETSMRIGSLVVCPACLGKLLADRQAITCVECEAVYVVEEGWPILLTASDQRFDDVADCCLNADEIRTNTFTTRNYSIPLLRKLAGRELAGLRLLSAGCGVGVDVDLYRAAGIEAYGVDCGSRIAAWAGRQHPEALHFASVAHLPFPDATFDAVVTGCLLPHIGVVGDSVDVSDGVEEARQQVAREMLRVTRPGGHIVMGNPNRLCPVDLFHKGQMAHPAALGRWHPTTERFLLSFDDHVRLFGNAAVVSTLPVSGYWGFHSKQERPATWVLAQLLKAYLRLLSLPPLDRLRRSGFNPWLMVLATKAEV